MPLAAGTRIGPYEVLAPLGAGGMGEVYRAVDTRLGRHVAVKISTGEFTGRFRSEARANSAHPHICTLYEVGPNFLVMELVEGETLANVLNDLSSALANSARYEEALQAAEKSVSILDSVGAGFTGPEAASIRIAALCRWGTVLRTLGRYSDAEPVLRRAIDAATKEFGPEDDRTASALNELGVLFKFACQFDEAEKLYRGALRILEANHSPDSLETASVWHNLGGLAHARGRFAAGEPAARKAWEIRSACLGPDHPETLADEAALAGILDGLERYQDSEPIYRRVIAAFARVYGPEHFEVAVNLNNLAAVRDARGDAHEAEAPYRRSLDIKEKLFGREHVEVALTALNFASFLLDHGRWEEAAPLAELAEPIFSATLAPDHPASLAANKLLRQLARVSRQAAP